MISYFDADSQYMPQMKRALLSWEVRDISSQHERTRRRA